MVELVGLYGGKDRQGAKVVLYDKKLRCALF